MYPAALILVIACAACPEEHSDEGSHSCTPGPLRSNAGSVHIDQVVITGKILGVLCVYFASRSFGIDAVTELCQCFPLANSPLRSELSGTALA